MLHPPMFSTWYSGTTFPIVSRKRQNNQKHWKTFETLEAGLGSFWTNRKPPRPALSRGRAACPQKQNALLSSRLLGEKMRSKLYFGSLWEKGVKPVSGPCCLSSWDVGTCHLPILYICLFHTASTPKLLTSPSPLPCPLGNHKFISYVCESVSVS